MDRRGGIIEPDHPTGAGESGRRETEASMVIGPLLLALGIGLLAGHLLIWIIIGLGAGITLNSVVSGLRPKGVRGRR